MFDDYQIAIENAQQKEDEIVDEYKGDKKELFIESGVHYSVKGSNLVAKLLLSKLKENGTLSFTP